MWSQVSGWRSRLRPRRPLIWASAPVAAQTGCRGNCRETQDGASVGVSGRRRRDVDAGATVGNTQDGASVGVSGTAGGVDVDAGASAGTGNGSAGTSTTRGNNSVGATGDNSDVESVGIANKGASIGHTARGSASQNSRQLKATSRSGDSPATTAGIVRGNRQFIVLPRILLPRGGGDRSAAVPAPALEARPGTSGAIVRTCRSAVEAAARPYGVINVRAKSSGPARQVSGGLVSAPLHVRIKYQRQGGTEIRQARIKCQLDAAGRVVKLI